MTKAPSADEEFLADAAEIAKKVTSGPNCRTCGFPMEPGTLVIRSGQPITAGLVWHDRSDRSHVPGPAVETLPWGPGGAYHALVGFRCPECRRLELGYGADSGGSEPPTAP